MNGRIFRALILSTTGLALAVVAPPALAQDGSDETRIRKLEAEVRALQRRVFPGGDGRYFEPQITGQPQQQATATPQTSTTAVTDILARLDALESQIQQLTAQNEENTYALRQLTARVDAMTAAGPATDSQTAQPGGTRSAPPTSSNDAETRSAATNVPAGTRPAVSAPSPERLAAVQAIAKPQTDDAGDDEYSYGYRLWKAGFYPEAQQQLTLFVEQHPDHWRTTYARNLLGRAYLDDGKPTEAAPWFLRNYQGDKTAARAGDSLLYLAEAMAAQSDTRRACIALAEFAETYPALATGRLRTEYESQRAKAKCN
ncbi:MAG: tetratricopeptide repeat protein [Qipengyuania sp.]